MPLTPTAPLGNCDIGEAADRGAAPSWRRTRKCHGVSCLGHISARAGPATLALALLFASRPELPERLAVEFVRPSVVRPEPQYAPIVFINREHFNRGLALLDGIADFLFSVVFECTRCERRRP